jgi:multicomponent Na+:H+ antiporter subunit F
MEILILTVAGVLVVSIALATIRLVLGPSLVNRVVALDVIAVLGTALTALFAIQFDRRVILDVTMILALVSFVGTVAFAYYVDRGGR